MNIINLVGGRKVMGKLLIVAAGLVIAWVKGDVPPNLLVLLLGAYGLYVGGNVGSSMAAGKAPTIDMKPISMQLDQLAEATATTQQGVGLLVNYVSGNPGKQ